MHSGDRKHQYCWSTDHKAEGQSRTTWLPLHVNNSSLSPQGFWKVLSPFHEERSQWSDVTVMWRMYLREADSVSFRKGRSCVRISECKAYGDTHVAFWIKYPLFCESRGCFDKLATDFNHKRSLLMRNVCHSSNVYKNKAWVCMYLCQMNIHASWVILKFLYYNLEWKGLSTTDLKNDNPWHMSQCGIAN